MLPPHISWKPKQFHVFLNTDANMQAFIRDHILCNFDETFFSMMLPASAFKTSFQLLLCFYYVRHQWHHLIDAFWLSCDVSSLLNTLASWKESVAKWSTCHQEFNTWSIFVNPPHQPSERYWEPQNSEDVYLHSTCHSSKENKWLFLCTHSWYFARLPGSHSKTCVCVPSPI